MLKIVRTLLQPSYLREPIYLEAFGPEPVSYACARCVSDLVTTVREFSPLSDLKMSESIRQEFDLNRVGKSPDGGLAEFALVKCNGCGLQTLFYAGILETSHSVFRVTLQGVAEVSDE